MSILLLVFTDILVQFTDVRTDSDATVSVEQDGRYILDRLSYDLRRSMSISLPANPGDSSPGLTLIIGGVGYNYSLVNGNFQLGTLLGNDNLNSNGTVMLNPTFTKVGSSGGKSTIKIQFTLDSTAVKTQGVESKTFQTTVGQR